MRSPPTLPPPKNLERALAVYKIVLINGYLSRVLNAIITDNYGKNHLAQEAIFHFFFH